MSARKPLFLADTSSIYFPLTTHGNCFLWRIKKSTRSPDRDKVVLDRRKPKRSNVGPLAEYNSRNGKWVAPTVWRIGKILTPVLACVCHAPGALARVLSREKDIRKISLTRRDACAGYTH